MRDDDAGEQMRLLLNGWMIAEERVPDGELRPLFLVNDEAEAQDFASQLRTRGLRVHVIDVRDATNELRDRL